MREPLKVLIVEDLPTDAELSEREVRSVLPLCEFLRVETRQDFLAALENFRPDIVLSDFKLPHFDGLTALKLAEELAPDVPFIIVTGSTNEDTAVECMKAGAWDYVIKEHIKRLGPAILNTLEQRRLQRARTAAEERLKLALSAANQGIYDLNIQTGEEIVTPEYATMLGYDPAEFHETNAAWIERLHPDDRSPVSQVYRDYVAGRLPDYRVEFRQRMKSGEWKWILSLGSIVERDADGRPLRMVGTHTDITDRKHMEAALRESEERYRTVADYTYDWEYWRAPDGTFLYMSPSCERITGYRPDEFIANSRLLEEIVAPADRQLLERHKAETLHTHRDNVVHEAEFRIVRKDGGERWIAHICQMIRRADGVSMGLRASNRDVTDHKKVMAQLLQTQKIEAVGQLAGGIAHDFNNVLNAVAGYAGLLQMRVAESDPLRTFIDEIAAAAQRGGALTHQILAFSRKQVLTLKPVSLNGIVANLETMLRRLVREDISIEIRLPGRDLVISADAGQIDQVMLNLATNARDAMPGGGRINITVEPFVMDASYIAMHGYGVRGDYALLTVSDTGSGMDPETRSRIFDPFFTTKEAGKGTGLGLAVVHGIVKQHNGFINVYSELGRGTVFKIYLPVAASRVAQKAPVKKHTAVRGGSETILLAEDDPALRRITAVILTECGYNVIAAIDGEDAVAKFYLHRDSIQLAVLDGIMPKKNGRQALEEIRRENPGLRALFVSGYTNDVFDEGSISEGTTAFIRKPVNPDDLLGMIRELLDNK